MKLRQPTYDDISEMNELFKIVTYDTFAREGLEDLKEEIQSTIDEKRECLMESLSSGNGKIYFVIACINEKIVGSIACGPSSQLIIDCTNGEFKEVLEMGTVYVLPDYQGKGIGTKLIEAFYDKILELGENEFCLDSGYKIAGSIWKKKFGNPKYIMKDYWDKGYDHLIWHVKLD